MSGGEQAVLRERMENKSMPTSWRKETKPHRFCPGCGHGIALKALGEAVDELGILDRVLYGCDIGCSLLSWDFFNVDSIQTHHGRTIPLIVGAKRARPEVIGIAYMGDGGGYAIGAQHLVNTAMRGDRITAILANNTLYAMTGGQLAPTTLPGQKTGTTPYGRDVEKTGSPLLGPELVAAIAPKGTYVARGTVGDYNQLKRYLKKALRNQLEGRGFSFVEVLSTCPTNWRTNAKETWGFLQGEMERYFKVGELRVPELKDAEQEV
jgi:2-oxoglutarate ferredoxin oxidoreductase subunit beta